MPTARLAYVASLVLLGLAVRMPAQGPVQAGKVEVVAVAIIAPRVAHDEPGTRLGSLPFTAADVIHYFSTALEMSSEKTPNGGTAFENRHDPQPEERWRIEVQTEGKNVVVEFTVGGNYGLSLAREFFESPLFQRDEFERFYALLSSAQNEPTDKMRRFTVTMILRDTKESQVLTLRFTPREK